ncbi:MAG TPA: class I SAM-dependent methyltransferase [Casimicrobiaceae bacterium]|nr:class I SAM-dependent methyltransferase [Casimicrobiaceae bacterium]
MENDPVLQWVEDGQPRAARWRSERGAPPPGRVTVVDDTVTADEAYGLACQGTGLLWRGDFPNARQMLIALASRADRPTRKPKRGVPAPAIDVPRGTPAMAAAFHRHRQGRSQRARTLGMLLIELAPDYGIDLRRAPDLRQACREAYGPAEETASVVSLRELLGLVGAHEWRVKGIDVPAAGGRIHPHYGVFAPVRREYVDLVAAAPLPAAAATTSVAFDVGTGTGVLAAVLARRGLARVIATDRDPRALACARENIAQLGLHDRVEVVAADLFPEGRAALVLCNPPWLPARPSAPLEHAIFDPDSRMLRGFLAGLPSHLVPAGEGWLVLSDLAEHLGLRTRAELMEAFDGAGLRVVDRIDVRPVHPKASDASDPLHAARAAEVTSLWRLAVR